MCGGTTVFSTRADSSAGLSPRVRGHHGVLDAGRFLSGSIPACAGAPLTAEAGRIVAQVYPRVCGGTTQLVVEVVTYGVYPRVCGGTSTADTPGTSESASIPACAGAPETNPRTAAGHRVYPRVCGGTSSSRPSRSSRSGLSPRVRGHQRHDHRDALRVWSIPACAGAPPSLAEADTLFKVYPRVCGGTHTLP